jgi:predicted ATPase
MLSKLRVQHYKSLFDTEIDLEPLTVFIGPNGSGKSNICESLAVIADFLQSLVTNGNGASLIEDFFMESFKSVNQYPQTIQSKLWHGKLDNLFFDFSNSIEPNYIYHNDRKIENNLSVLWNFPSKRVSINNTKYNAHQFIEESIGFNHSGAQTYTTPLRDFLVSSQYLDSPLASSLKKVSIYDFAPTALSNNASSTLLTNSMDRTGQGIAYALVDILHTNRERFDELEERLTRLVPNIKRISLPRTQNQTFSLELIDRYSEHHIPASDISDGTLRILGFLTALYQENTPSIICFEEIENGIHPWLLHKMMELLKIVSTEGITGNPVQVLITTHSPVLLNYVEPHQVRAVELDGEGKTQVHNLPVDSVRFQKALEAYDGDLGELWFTNVFGGNPE